MSEVIRGFETIQGVAKYDYQFLENIPPLIKTINNKKPDNNGNIELDIDKVFIVNCNRSGADKTNYEIWEAYQKKYPIYCIWSYESGVENILVPALVKSNLAIFIITWEERTLIITIEDNKISTKEYNLSDYYISKENLSSAINKALATAKASGEFDGDSVSHSWNGTILNISSASGTSSANLKGDPGDPGYTPIKGIDYFDGEKGDKGDKGDIGPQGLIGPQGEKGEKGESGNSGLDGISITSIDSTKPSPHIETGEITSTLRIHTARPDGSDSKLYTCTIKHGRDYNLTEADRIEIAQMIEVPKDGKDGVDGKDGIDGKQGEPGPQGPQGPQGEKGEKGDKGDKGEPGNDGSDGKDGKDGVDGKDGITPHIGLNGNWYIGENDTNVSASGNSSGNSSGMFTMSVDEQGNLYMFYEDGAKVPTFEMDDECNLYYVFEE